MTDSEGARPSRGGRPRASSRRTLEDAASELFLEQGYARTTIDQIARRAGVGRNTFFNYFATKSELLWIEVDDTLRGLPDVLLAVPVELPPSAALLEAVLGLARRHPHRAVPIALTQRGPMGVEGEFLASGLSRFLEVADRLAGFVAARCGRPADDPSLRAAVNAVTAACATGAGAWALAGVERGSLVDFVRSAVEPVCRGFAPILDAASPANR